MIQEKRQLFQDIILLAVSVGFAVFIVETGIAGRFIISFGSLRYLGALLAGIFFTSIFTTAPSIALLGELAQTVPLPLLAVWGGAGAVAGDYILFRFLRGRIFKDVDFLLFLAPSARFRAIFQTKLFKFFIPFLGALIIASPFPDEIGVALLGASKIKGRAFLLLSFVLNGLGIFLVGWVARIVAGL